MGAVRSKVSADLRHRRLQGVAIGLVLLLASGAATLALSILVEAQAPFDRAFARTNGAHLVVDYDGAVPIADLAATVSAPPVATGAGPWPVTSGAILHPRGGILEIGTVSGRAVADPGIDRVTMVSGRWWANPGEVVLDASEAAILGAAIGDSVELVGPPEHKREASGGGRALVPPKSEAPTEPPASVTLTVVGIAASVSTPDVIAWASPADVAALAGEAAPHQRMLYRLVRAESSAELGEALRAMSQPLPADAVVDSRTYLDTKAEVDELASLYVPVLLAFSVFALLAAGFMVANVVSGIVLANYRDIGIMKALGFTPADVVKVLLAQVFVPAGLGTAFGLLLGTLASRPTVEATARSFGVPGEFIPTWWILVCRPRHRARGDRAGRCRPRDPGRADLGGCRDRPRTSAIGIAGWGPLAAAGAATAGPPPGSTRAVARAGTSRPCGHADRGAHRRCRSSHLRTGPQRVARQADRHRGSGRERTRSRGAERRTVGCGGDLGHDRRACLRPTRSWPSARPRPRWPA